MKQEKSAGAVIFQQKRGEVLFLLLKYPHYWGFAKGWIEENESEEQAARREIEEETGLKDVKIIPGFKFEQNWIFKFNNELIKKRAVFFLVEVSEEEAKNVKISEEHEDFFLEKS